MFIEQAHCGYAAQNITFRVRSIAFSATGCCNQCLYIKEL